jgi:hypothetical protein
MVNRGTEENPNYELSSSWARKFQIMDDLGILPPGDPSKWVRAGVAHADPLIVSASQPQPEPQTVFDSELGKEVPYRGQIKGIISFDKSNKPVMGWFTKNKLKNAKYSMPGVGCTMVWDYKMLEEKGFILGTSDGMYYDPKQMGSESLRAIKTKRIAVKLHNAQYNVVDDKNSFNEAIALHKQSEFPIDKDIKYISKYIKNFTFGLELEAINGMLPDHILAKYGTMVCRDGSLRDSNGNYPPEYVTVPLQGAKGLQTLRNLCAELQKHSDIDNRCSLHLHLGGFDMDRTFLVSLYNLCYKIQDQIFDIFPFYKRDEVKYAGKQKNYCKMLPNTIMNYGSGNFKNYVERSYQDIYRFLSGGSELGPANNFAQRQNPWGGNKWDIKSRYYWLNLTNIAFGKQQTVEFRIHTPTFNFDKIMAWLLMCTSIIEYAKNYIMESVSSQPINFRHEVLNYYNTLGSSTYAGFFTDNLKAYYDYRRKYFADLARVKDYKAAGETAEDFGFKFNIIKL